MVVLLLVVPVTATPGGINHEGCAGTLNNVLGVLTPPQVPVTEALTQVNSAVTCTKGYYLESHAAACPAPPFIGAVTGAYCGPMAPSGVVTCQATFVNGPAMRPPQHAIIIGIDYDGDGLLQMPGGPLAGNDEATEILTTTVPVEVAFPPPAPPNVGRVIVLSYVFPPVHTSMPYHGPVVMAIGCV